MNRPLVSICIPTRNGEKFLEEALRSIEEQKYPNIEVVISDDDSKDATLSLCEKFRDRTKFNVNIYRHKPNGIGANWNNCLKHARGEYIKFLFQDDILFHDCIDKMMKILFKNDDIYFLACKRKIIAEDPLETWQQNWISKYDNLQKGLISSTKGLTVLDYRFLKEKDFFRDPFNKVGEPTAILFRKSILAKTGIFREDLKIVLDIEFYYRVLKNYKITIMDEKLVGFRLHSDQASKTEVAGHKKEFQTYREILYKELFWNLSRTHQLQLVKWKIGQVFRFL